MKKLAAVLIALGMTALTALECEAQNRAYGESKIQFVKNDKRWDRNWNNNWGHRRSWQQRRSYDNRWFGRHDRGRHLGWYKNRWRNNNNNWWWWR